MALTPAWMLVLCIFELLEQTQCFRNEDIGILHANIEHELSELELAILQFGLDDHLLLLEFSKLLLE
jgi:hypothetical protein